MMWHVCKNLKILKKFLKFCTRVKSLVCSMSLGAPKQISIKRPVMSAVSWNFKNWISCIIVTRNDDWEAKQPQAKLNWCLDEVLYDFTRAQKVSRQHCASKESSSCMNAASRTFTNTGKGSDLDCSWAFSEQSDFWAFIFNQRWCLIKVSVNRTQKWIHSRASDHREGRGNLCDSKNIFF